MTLRAWLVFGGIAAGLIGVLLGSAFVVLRDARRRMLARLEELWRYPDDDTDPRGDPQ